MCTRRDDVALGARRPGSAGRASASLQRQALDVDEAAVDLEHVAAVQPLPSRIAPSWLAPRMTMGLVGGAAGVEPKLPGVDAVGERDDVAGCAAASAACKAGRVRHRPRYGAAGSAGTPRVVAVHDERLVDGPVARRSRAARSRRSSRVADRRCCPRTARAPTRPPRSRDARGRGAARSRQATAPTGR